MFPRRSAMIPRTVGLIITLILGLLAAPLAAEAQKPGQVSRIGILALDQKLCSSEGSHAAIRKRRLSAVAF